MTNTGQVILVVEDDASMRAAIERLVRLAGMQCRTYGSAEELLANGADQPAACVISDVRLPEMTGLELLSRLRKQGDGPPVILITAFDTPGQRDDATRRGAAAYLIKPFSGTALLAAIREVVKPTAEDPEVQGG